jgi:phage terminase large subunit-like protein
VTLLAFMNLFEEFRDASWNGWREHLAKLTPDVREFFAIVGRGAGKSRVVALLACFFASKAYHRRPGESIYIGVFAPDRKQAGVTFRYVVGLLKSVPALAALIVSESKDSVELSNGVIIEVLTASVAAPRGRAYALVIVEEAAFLPTDDSANPDVELLRAVRPALARVPGLAAGRRLEPVCAEGRAVERVDAVPSRR